MNVVLDFDTVKRKPKIISEHLPVIRELFSAEDKAQTFVRRRFGKGVPMRKYAFTAAGYFDTPFYETLTETVTCKFPIANIIETESFKANCRAKKIAEKICSLNLEPRDYQKESVLTALKNGRGVIVLPTSAGKTLVMALLAKSFTESVSPSEKVIMLVPNLQLVHQSYKDFLEYGISQDDVSIWTGNNDLNITKYVIANYQILLSEKQNSKEVLKHFSCCIVDECHKMHSAQQITKLIKSQNYKHIFGLTGSLPADIYDIWSINRVFGKVLYHKKSIELREEKYISKVQVAAIKLQYTNIPEFSIPSMSNPTAGFEEEISWLQTNKFRNNVIGKIVNNTETNTLILVDRIAHGEHLLEYLTNELGTTKQIYFIQGSVDIEERESIRKLMEEQNKVVCIAISKIFSTGISIKNLHNVVFAAIGKARIKIIQSIGRSLRLHHTKQIATIFDIADINLQYGSKHFREREELYRSEKIPVTTKLLVEPINP